MDIETLPKDTILIVGGGPVGLILATTLAHHSVKSVLLERNLTTTRWPKMDLTTARSMEIFRRLGISSGLREKGVLSQYPFTCLFSSGLHANSAISSWDLPSVDAFRKDIERRNDGSMPGEPWQRVSQEVFEAWLKELGDENQLVELRYGVQVTNATEHEDGVEVEVTDVRTGEEKKIRSSFAAGCDGANSVMRNTLGIGLDKHDVPGTALLVHFKSKDLARLQKQGQFWHIFLPNAASAGGGIKGALIAQDEIDTWTVHSFLPPGFDDSALSSEDAVYSVLGGMGDPFPIQIDEVLVRSRWTTTIGLANAYAGRYQRVLLAGDACHQTVPTGGYGMNLGIADAFDLGWKLAATVHGWGGPGLLASYEVERRPVAELSLFWSKTHMMKLLGLSAAIGLEGDIVESKTVEGESMRAKVNEYVRMNDAHNRSIGVEMGYRYVSLIIVDSDNGESLSGPPEFDPRRYIPTTYPGYRAPHVFLKGGQAISDSFGPWFTLVEFGEGNVSQLVQAAESSQIPLTHVSLQEEDHAREIWGARMVLVRPDGFVSWRGDTAEGDGTARDILLRATGHKA